METRCYEICLNTSLGKRKGTLQLNISDNDISGYIFLFNNKEPFTGKIDKNGTCQIEGKFVTILNEFIFTATGKIQEDTIQLALKTKSREFTVDGKRQTVVKI